MNITFIYALCDPRTLEVRYIGKADDPSEEHKRKISESLKKRKQNVT